MAEFEFGVGFFGGHDFADFDEGIDDVVDGFEGEGAAGFDPGVGFGAFAFGGEGEGDTDDLEVGGAAGHDFAKDAEAVAVGVVELFRGDAAFEFDGEAIEDVLDFTIAGGVVGGDHADLKFAVFVFGDAFFEVFASEGREVCLAGDRGEFVEAFFGEASV